MLELLVYGQIVFPGLGKRLDQSPTKSTVEGNKGAIDYLAT